MTTAKPSWALTTRGSGDPWNKALPHTPAVPETFSHHSKQTEDEGARNPFWVVVCPTPCCHAISSDQMQAMTTLLSFGCEYEALGASCIRSSSCGLKPHNT